MKILTMICLMCALISCGPSSTKQTPASAPAVSSKAIYTCTMHPEVKTDKPGVCPKCGMDLVEKE